MHATPAADRKAEVTTRFIRDDKCVEISIRDRGCGIPPADLERIFQPFMSTKLHGMGLGLAICRSVVESHRGHLWAENGAEHGAIFHLKVPVEGGLQ
jgi:signal transduction histidine kinase